MVAAMPSSANAPAMWAVTQVAGTYTGFGFV